jgi:hypothetical protein
VFHDSHLRTGAYLITAKPLGNYMGNSVLYLDSLEERLPSRILAGASEGTDLSYEAQGLTFIWSQPVTRERART